MLFWFGFAFCFIVAYFGLLFDLCFGLVFGFGIFVCLSSGFGCFLYWLCCLIGWKLGFRWMLAINCLCEGLDCVLYYCFVV